MNNHKTHRDTEELITCIIANFGLLITITIKLLLD